MFEFKNGMLSYFGLERLFNEFDTCVVQKK